MADQTITRVLSLHQNIHVYAIPPLTSNSGFNASAWTSPPGPTAQEIFQARLRILEHSTSSPNNQITAEILLEDPKTGELFAAAPYTSAAVVQSAQDSSRFFAIRVQGEGGRKATLGIGFEERAEAFDFGVVLGDLRKGMGMERGTQQQGGRAKAESEEVKKDFSLKEGEKIQIHIGGKGSRKAEGAGFGGNGKQDEGSALFSIAPPPGGGGLAAPPPPAAAAPSNPGGKSAQELGFDDGEFGEFQ